MLYVVDRHNGRNIKLVTVTTDSRVAYKAIQVSKKIRFPESVNECYTISEYWDMSFDDFERWNDSGVFPDANMTYAV